MKLENTKLEDELSRMEEVKNTVIQERDHFELEMKERMKEKE